MALTPILVIACEDKDDVRPTTPPTDCVDQGGLCFFWGYGPYGAEGIYEQKHVACDPNGPRLETEECPGARPTKDPSGPWKGCCKPRTCAGGRGTCHEPCPAEKVITENDPDCDWGGVRNAMPLYTPCCAP
jgi:hypothetical protein